MDDRHDVTSAEQFHAFGHPLRQRLMLALGQEPATISQLAARLRVHKGSVAHHLKVLRDAGLVHLGQKRQVRGGTEQYYERSARRYTFAGPLTTSQSAMAVRAAAEEISASTLEPFVIVRQLRLSARQVDTLVAAMTSLAGELEEAGSGESRYSLLLGVYQLG